MRRFDFSTSSLYLLGGLLLWLLSCLPATAGNITVAGTGDSQRLLRQLAQRYQQLSPDCQVQVPDSVGSSGGIRLLLAGRSDLARVARLLKPSEQAQGLRYRLLAYSPVVFVANLPEPCLEDISAEQIVAIFSGEQSSWAGLGTCPDHKIYLATREEGDSSRSILEQQIPGLVQINKPVGRTIFSTPETFETISRYPYSFGYLPLSQIHNSRLTLLRYQGVSATAENVQQTSYPLTVPLGIVWRGELNGTTRQFVDFLFSPTAHQLIRQLGAVPAATE